jgi:hypothetical protein
LEGVGGWRRRDCPARAGGRYDRRRMYEDVGCGGTETSPGREPNMSRSDRQAIGVTYLAKRSFPGSASIRHTSVDVTEASCLEAFARVNLDHSEPSVKRQFLPQDGSTWARHGPGAFDRHSSASGCRLLIDNGGNILGVEHAPLIILWLSMLTVPQWAVALGAKPQRAKLPPGFYSSTLRSECHRTRHLTVVACRRP